MLVNQGLNGYWTAYIIMHVPKKPNLHSLESWLLHRAPSILARQERFQIFQRILQSYLKNDIHIASIVALWMIC